MVHDLDAARSSYTSKSHTQAPKSTSSQYPNRFQAQASNHKMDAKGKNVEDIGKSIEKDFSKVSPTMKCYMRQVYGHVTANCSSPVKIVIINGMPIAEPEPESDVFTYQPDKVESNNDEEITGDDVCLHCIRPTSLDYLSFVRCALSQQKEEDDCRQTTMFHTLTRIGGKSCKVIVDSGYCINAISSTVITKFELKVVPHPHSYRVTWINSSALEVK